MTELVWHDVGRGRRRLRRARSGGSRPAGAPSASSRLGGAWIAFDDTCTHEECSLAEGELDGAVVVCPCHGSEFDVRTGDVLTPPALDPLPIYEAREEGGALLVRLSPPPVADGGRARARRPRHGREQARAGHGRGAVARRVSRSTTSTSPTSTCGSAASRTTGSRSCAATRRSSGSRSATGRGSGRSRATTTSSRSRRTGRRSRPSSAGRRSRT